jgi:hypothetical protein
MASPPSLVEQRDFFVAFALASRFRRVQAAAVAAVIAAAAATAVAAVVATAVAVRQRQLLLNHRRVAFYYLHSHPVVSHLVLDRHFRARLSRNELANGHAAIGCPG